MNVVAPLLILLAGISVVIGVFGPAAEHLDSGAFWKKQIAIGPMLFLGAACLLPLSYLIVGRDLGVFYFLPALSYSVALLIASAIGIVVTRGRRILVWLAAFAAAVLPVMVMSSSPLHGP